MSGKEKLRFILNKALSALVTLLLVTLFSFLLMRLSPIDPAEAYVKRNSALVTEERIEAARVELGLDKPLYVQYVNWMRNALRLDFGISLGSGHTVLHEVQKALPTTISIVVWAALFTIAGVLGLGFLEYILNDRLGGKVLCSLGILGISIPAFYFSTAFLNLFALKWKMISVAGNTGAARYVPAALCLSISGICFYAQMLSNALIREMEQDYCVFAKCRGLAEGRILVFHALPHVLVDLLPNFAQMLGLCFAGAAIVERVFSQFGIGYLIIDSVIARDAPVTHAAVLILASVLVMMDFLAEVFQKVLKREL
ncbi:MAG: ABC transporter permease [Lachnospiraceae bacterium]